MKKYLFFVICVIVLISCGEKTPVGETEFHFDKPQPINDSELTSIPSKFIGKYSNSRDKILIVSESAIYEQINASYPKAMIDSLGFFKNGKLTTHDTREILDAEIKGDSIYIKGIFVDTIFKFSQVHKMKRINGSLVVSSKDSIFWRANIISSTEDSLKIKYLTDKEDYNQIKLLVRNIKTNEDTTIVKINPTRREFGKILKIKKFSWERAYKKIK